MCVLAPALLQGKESAGLRGAAAADWALSQGSLVVLGRSCSIQAAPEQSHFLIKGLHCSMKKKKKRKHGKSLWGKKNNLSLSLVRYCLWT